MFVESRGSGVDVVFLHGMPQAPSDLTRVAARLDPERVRTHVVHLSGYGRSEPAGLPYELDAVHTALEDQLIALGCAEPVIVGMSAGCYRALALTRRSRVTPRGIIGLGPLGYLDDANKEALRGFAGALGAGMDMSALVAARLFSERYLSEHPERIEEVAALLSSIPSDMLASELIAFVDAEDLRPHLSELDVPIAFRVGSLDVPTPPAHARELAALLPSVELEVVDGVGHMLTFEDLEGTAGSIASHVEAWTKGAER